MAGRRTAAATGWRVGWGALGYIALAAMAVLVATIVFFDLVDEHPTASRWRTGWAVGSVVVSALLLGVLAREVLRRIRSERTLARAQATVSSIGGLMGDRAHNEPLERALHDLLGVLTGSVRADEGVLLLADERGGQTLSVQAVCGSETAGLGLEGVTFEEVKAREAPSVRAGRSLVMPLGQGTRTLGAVVARCGSGRFGPDAAQVLRVAAERAGAAIDRARLADRERRSRLGEEHARRLVGLIAKASGVLSPALEEPDKALRALLDVLVPEYADWCSIELTTDGGGLSHLASLDAEKPPVDPADAVGALRSDWQAELEEVLATGSPKLAFLGSERAFGSPRSHQLLRSLGLESWIIVPIRLRGLSLGAISIGTRKRRGFRLSDIGAMQEMATRCASTLERGLLYAEARKREAQAERRAEQRARLLEATIVFNRSLRPDALLEALVRQAQRLFDATHARAAVEGDAGARVAGAAHPGDRAPTMTAALFGSAGRTVGRLDLWRPASAAVTADDEAMLMLLTQLASVALLNAELYAGLWSREQRLEALIEASPLAILELDRRGAVHQANPAARSLFPSRDPEAVVELPPELMARLADLAQRSAAGESGDAELTCEHANGPLELWASTAPLSDADGQLSGTLAVVADITRRKQLEAQLLASQRFEAIAGLAGGVAHDFNNILTVVVGYSELLLRRADPDAAGTEELAAIAEAGHEAAVITNQLLALSRQQVLQPSVVRAASAVDGMRPMLQRLAGGEIEIVTRSEDDSAAIRIDPGQLDQVLLNLVINSRDAMPGGGTITIETSTADGVEFGPHLVLRVSDTGHGMPPEVLRRCLEPFYTSKEHGKGTGLGLATVAGVVNRSGGTLDIASEPGQGTVVTARFPLVEAVGTDVAEPGTIVARALLVEDDDDVRRLTSAMLGDAGYVVTAASSAEEALQTVSADGAFEILVSDVVMPGMNGVDLAKRLRAAHPGMAVVLVTGFADSDVLRRKDPDTPVVMKPFTAEELLTAAAGALHSVGGPGGPRSG